VVSHRRSIVDRDVSSSLSFDELFVEKVGRDLIGQELWADEPDEEIFVWVRSRELSGMDAPVDRTLSTAPRTTVISSNNLKKDNVVLAR